MEIYSVFNDMDITYGELAQVLQHLKFKNKSTEKAFVYVLAF